MIIAKYIAVVLISYLLGSIPFGLLIGRRSAKVDVRQIGSGKTGATNVWRVAGKKAAVLVAALDIYKGALAVVIAGLIFAENYQIAGGSNLLLARSGQVLAALAALFGHKWPVFVKFKGGRGVATFLGAMFVLCPPAAIFGGEILIIGAGLTRYVSLGSIAGVVGTYTLLVPLTVMNNFPIEYLVYALFGAIFIIVMHRDNIIRLLSGKERRWGEKVEIKGIAFAAEK